MKIERYARISLLVIFLCNMIHVAAMDQGYRSAAMEKMQQAKAVAQQKLQEGWKTTKEFAFHHKKKLIGAGAAILTLAAITLAKLGYDKKQREAAYRLTEQTIKFKKVGKDYFWTDQNEINRTMAYLDMAQGLESVNAVRNQVAGLGKSDVALRTKWINQFDEDVRDIPNLKLAIEFLAKKK